MTFEGGEASMSELCRIRHQPQDGLQVLARWRSEGALGLAERSRAPHSSPHRSATRCGKQCWRCGLPSRLGAEVEAAARARPSAGSSARDEHDRGSAGPHGPVGSAQAGSACGTRTTPLAHCQEANDTWAMDFKGWFRAVDGSRCDPLTIQDQASRYLDPAGGGRAHRRRARVGRPDAAFREFGLPKAMRSDNGAPFASTGAGGLSALSVRLIKPACCPSGSLRPARSRMAASNVCTDARAGHGQSAGDLAARPGSSLRNVLPGLRRGAPARSIDLAVPASLYVPSPRCWSGRLRSPDMRAARLCGTCG